MTWVLITPMVTVVHWTCRLMFTLKMKKLLLRFKILQKEKENTTGGGKDQLQMTLTMKGLHLICLIKQRLI